MNSNYSAARENLEKAYGHLGGEEETSQKMREAIGILIDAMIAIQFKRSGQVLAFSPKQREGTGQPKKHRPMFSTLGSPLKRKPRHLPVAGLIA